MNVERAGWWSDEGHIKMPPDGEFSDALRWIINQINLRFFECAVDDKGNGESLLLGRATASEADFETAKEGFIRRQFALNLAGLFANARERGVRPQDVESAEEVRFNADQNGYMNTEIHYALQLMDILRDMRRRSFELVTLPLVGNASEQLINLLHEATRAHLFGLHAASLALCRAALERALIERVPPAAVAAERQRRHDGGELENLVNAAACSGLLDGFLTSVAHGLRKRANDVLHGNAVLTDSMVNIGDTRMLVERLFAAKEAI